MKTHRIGLAVALLVAFALAQGVKIPWQSLNAGGGPGGSMSFRLNGSLGQVVQGTGTAAGASGYWGFWVPDEGPPPVASGWQEVKQMPDVPTAGKAPKDGAWLVVGPDGPSPKLQASSLKPEESESEADGGKLSAGGVVYAAKGNKTCDFHKYYPGDNRWVTLPSIPDSEPALGRPKPVSKGSCAVSDGKEYLYMLKGNNTQGFWRYRIEDGRWDTLPRVPVKVKGGNDMVYVEGEAGDLIYLLAGGKTAFYRYSIAEAKWSELDSARYGNNKRKYDKGSFLVYDRARYLYAHQANQVGENAHHYMFRYDLWGDSWSRTALKGLPLFGTEGGAENKKKKSKDGAAGVWYDGSLYAIKGGGSQGFYKYDPAGAGTWTALETVPRNGSGGRKAVKAGADLVNWDDKAFFLLKGNKTYEMWRYGLGAVQAARFTPQASRAQAQTQAQVALLRIAPNPITTGFATVWVASGAVPGRSGRNPGQSSLQVRVFDAAGRCVLHHSITSLLYHSVSLDLRKLSAGVYLVRLDAAGMTASQKLVVK